MPTTDQTLQQGIQAVKGGNFERARRLFNRVIEEDPDSEQGWYWLGLVASDQDRRVACFLRALTLNPANHEARDRLVRLGVPIPEELDQAGAAVEGLPLDQEETGPLPPLNGPGGSSRPAVPEVFEPLDDSDLEELAGTEPDEQESEPGLAASQIYSDEDLTAAFEDEDLLEPGMTRQSSPIGRLLPILVVLLIVACASGVYLVSNSGGLPFGLALAPASATPSPSATRPPPTATHTATPQPSPTATPIPPSPTPVPTLSALDRLGQLEPQIVTASSLAASGQYPEAISTWDQIIAAAPDSAEAYFGRGRSYYESATLFRPIPENAQELLGQALSDLNQAIALGPLRGGFYLTRIEILDWLTKLEVQRENRTPYFEQMLSDVQSAAGYGLVTPFGEHNPASLLIRLGRCQEAMAYLGEQVAANPDAVPPAELVALIARTYLCYGQPRGAYLYANMANSLEPTPEHAWVRAITLYNLGRYNETLAALDDLLEANPDSPEDHYALRALVHFHRREYELAQADLDLGAQHALEQNGLADYAAGLLARQSGDQAGAEALFLQAEASLRLDYGLVFDRVRSELGLPAVDHGIPVLPNVINRYLDNLPETVQPRNCFIRAPGNSAASPL